ncbi:MAG: pyrroloquinoline quinone-dependent dehydrogenase [Halioglobus sp.]|nr:pyrroloquinoline quinone-dependent dehydrogenase [Halioglobus sp.]
MNIRFRLTDHPGTSALKRIVTLHGLYCLIATSLVFPAVSGVSSAVAEERQLGTKYSPLDDINRDNVSELEVAWEYHTGDIISTPGLTSFQDQPLLIGDNLIVCSVSRKVIALDPGNGKERWVYDPKSPLGGSNKCRGVTAWTDKQAIASQQCATRLFLGTSDYRLVAIDARTGKPCEEFGVKGEIQMEASKPMILPGEVSALSRPAVVNDVVVVGSSVMDNQRVDAPSGRLLAFDARTGAARWAFDPIPRDPADPAMQTWQTAPVNGGGNVWSGMVVDEALDLVYLPTSSPSVDFYGGDRPGDNAYADSVVALRGATGEVAWYQQLVHHDVWDYDLPTPGLLIDYPHNGEMVPALVQNTKQGMVFIFNRETGEPLVPIKERAVPQKGAVPGEKLSRTQPFPVGMPALVPHSFSPDDAWGFTFIDEWLCRREAETLSYGPIYTPPSEQGTVYLPSPSGGADWGGGAYDPVSHVMVVPLNTVAMIVTNTPREKSSYDPRGPMDLTAGFTFNNAGAPYVTTIRPFLSPLGAPCTAPPWAKLTAVDLVKKEIVWEVPLGSIEKMAPLPINWELGTPGVGAPLITAGGLVFIGFTLDHQFRAFDLNTGEVLWSSELPASANSVPVSYKYKGKQYIVVPAGGHSMFSPVLSDTVAAYKLP